ncbi:MAG: hypothetical protein WEC39_02250 [Patescibacteria group bacterium]
MDWVGMSLSIVGSYLLSSKNKWGWVVNIAACLVWVSFGILVIHSLAVVILNIFFVIISLRGFLNWEQ